MRYRFSSKIDVLYILINWKKRVNRSSFLVLLKFYVHKFESINSVYILLKIYICFCCCG